MHAINEVPNEWSQLVVPVSEILVFLRFFDGFSAPHWLCEDLCCFELFGRFSVAFPWFFGAAYFRWLELTY